MLRNIVVPLDGSRLGDRALPIAARIAREAGATLHLVMAQDPTQGIAPFAELGPPSVLLMEELDRRHEAFLERAAARIRKTAGVRVRVVYQDGAAGRVITQLVKNVKAGLVVMSTHGRGALGRLGLGSVADYVVRHLETPILLLPAKASVIRSIPGRRVLVPLDLSPESEGVLPALGELGALTGAMRLTILHVVEPLPLIAMPSMAAVAPDGALAQVHWDQARAQLARFEALARKRGIKATSRMVAGSRAAATILDQLNEGNFDLLAMTTHGSSGFRRLLLGSVTNKVIRNSRKPVLVIRPARKGERRK